MSELIEGLVDSGFEITEGSISPGQARQLGMLAAAPEVSVIGETGFNAGVSAYTFLSADPHNQVVSFDIGMHHYVHAAKLRIDEQFPGRHTLVLGDSRQTLPAFSRDNPETHFDLVFVDGGHNYKTSKADLLNFRCSSHEGTVIVMDDQVPWLPWGLSPTVAWNELRLRHIVEQEQRIKDGRFKAARAWAIGRYVLAN